MARLALKLFGSYRISLDGIPIDTQISDKGRALLGYLAVERNYPHTREKLVGLFWPEQDEEHARGSLSQVLYHLRGALGDRAVTGALPVENDIRSREPYLLVTSQEIQLNPQADFKTDVAEFSSLVAACKAHSHPPLECCEACLERYQAAALLYAGDLLENIYLPKNLEFEEWATIQREHLRLDAMGVLEQLVTAYERRGRFDQALGYARRMVQLDELGETSNQHVIRLLATMDQREEALLHYASFHHELAIQMGAEPGVESKILYQRIRKEHLGDELENLPATLTPFIGRNRELDDLWGLLRNPKIRLLCVLGPGGCGKTRLALEAARRLRYHFRDGAHYIPLSALAADSSLLAAIAASLGFSFREAGDPKRQLLHYLRHKKALLIFDSFETIVESAGLLAEILAESEGSKALVTSRVRLNQSSEHVYPLKGMRVPPPEAGGQESEYSAVELFLEAARRVKPGYQPECPEDVETICRLVEGMPLSLLLASTWVSDYSPKEIAEQISRSLDFLAVEWSDLPERQRSLRATFEYSWNLLSVREQDVLMKLSVFRNPFNIPAAQNVAGASLHMLHGLVGKSLLGSPAEGAYQMHDLVRQYSGEKLGQATNQGEFEIRQQHCYYFLQQASDWSMAFKGPRQSAVLMEADKAIDDVQSAWEWAAQQAEIEELLRASEGLLLFYNLRYRFQEGEHTCQVAIEGVKFAPVDEERLILEGILLAWQTDFYRLQGKAELARQSAEKSLERLTQSDSADPNAQWGQAMLWREYGYLSGSLPKQLAYLQRSAELFEALGDQWWQAWVLSWAGEMANRLGERKLSYDLFQQAVVLSRAAGEPRRLAYALRMLAYYLLIFGPWERGLALMKEATTWDRSAGDPGGLASADLQWGIALGWTGRYLEACNCLESAIENYNHLGEHYYVAYGTLALAIGQMNSGWYEQAARTYENALKVASQDGFHREEAYGLTQRACLNMIQGEKSQAIANAQQSVASFRQMGFAGELGMALGAFALAQHLLGQGELAWGSLLEAIKIFVQVKSRFTLFTLAAAVLVILADTGNWEQAVEVNAAVLTDPIVANSRWYADIVGDRIDLAREHLPVDVYLAAEQRGREGDMFEVLGRLLEKVS